MVISPAQADATRAILEEILAREAADATRWTHRQRVTRLAVKHLVFLFALLQIDRKRMKGAAK